MGIGVDIADVARLAAALDRTPALAERLFVDAERGLPVTSLAARFAAKEATIKVLRPVDHQPDWRSVEVRRDPAGWCTMALSGRAAVLADQAGITDLAVSLTHEGDLAAAVVVALCHSDAASIGQSGTSLAPEELGRDD